jgi:membrane fusion protein (multidrug efflux system)
MADSLPVRRRLGLAISCSLALALAACSGADANEERGRPPQAVGFVVVQPASAPLSTTLAGRVVAQETSEVRPQITGLVRRISFQPGGYVRAGQPLFQIDSSLYRAAAAEARAGLASAEANARAASARAARFKPLADMEAISRQEYDDAAAAAGAARAAVAQQRASLDTAQINLRFTNVPAPISGRIGRPLVTQGALVSSNQTEPLAIIQRTDSVYVDMQQSAADLTRLRRALAAANSGTAAGNTTVRLKFDDGTVYPATGTVQFSEISVNEGTGTVTLRARFPNPQGLLLPGMFVTAEFDQAIETGVFLVPQAAVQRDFNGDAFVFVVGSDGKAVRRVVQTQRTAGTNWVVTGGLKAGERVIVQGLNGLKSGAEVRHVQASAPQRIAAPPPGQEGASQGSGSGSGGRRGG